MERLRTYRFVDKWSAKPVDVNEVEWARRGWSCIDKNRVRCGVCKREVVVKVELDEEQDSDISEFCLTIPSATMEGRLIGL